MVTVGAVMMVTASSAMATNTALCTVHEEPCLGPKHLVTQIHLITTESPKFLPGLLGAITCGSSLIKGTVEGLGAPQKVKITAWTWTGCSGNGACNAVSTLNPLVELEILKTVLNLGEAKSKGNSISVNCNVLGGHVECEYSGVIGPFHIVGSSATTGNGMLTANGLNIQPNGAGLMCPTAMRLDALYEAQTPFFIVE